MKCACRGKLACLCTRVELLCKVGKNGIRVDGEMACSRIRKDSEMSLMLFLEQ